MPVQRWSAHRPPGAPGPSPRRITRRYAGPPTNRFGPPQWGFPAVSWRTATVADPQGAVSTSSRALRVVGLLSALTAAAALTAAGGELWRWFLLLRGRTEVLAGTVVSSSDEFLRIGGTAAGGLGLLTVIVLVPLLVRTHRAVELRAGLAPSRQPAGVLARLIVPGWNLYGAGQILTEIDSRLARDGSESPEGSAGRRPRAGRLVLAWWLVWLANGILVLITLGRAFGSSLQAIADTVQLHLMVDLAGAVSAALTSVLLLSFAARLSQHGRNPYPGWVVAPPAPTRMSRSGPVGGNYQLSTRSTAPGRDTAGPSISQTMVAARSPGDQPDPAADPADTVITPTP